MADKVIVANCPFSAKCHRLAERIAFKQKGVMVDVLGIMDDYREKFSDEEWYKGASLNGTRNAEMRALIEEKGGCITRFSVTKVHALYEKLSCKGGTTEVQKAIDAVESGAVKISDLVNSPPVPQGAGTSKVQAFLDWLNAMDDAGIAKFKKSADGKKIIKKLGL